MGLDAFARESLRAAIDEELDRFLASERRRLSEAAPLLDEISRIVRAGGKRLRPSFCYWGYRAAGGRHGDPILRAAAGLELLHTFAVVHDDIMDNSDERRGEPTAHVVHGRNFALLVGDLALVLADAAFIESGFPVDVLSEALHAYSRMRRHVIAGQYLDLASADKVDIDVSEARRIATLKSGGYTVHEPLVIGCALAGGSAGFIAGISAFGRPLGEAFQLRDDLLGTFGDRSSMGKPVDSDIREGKRNVLYAQTVARLTEPERTFFVERWGAGAALLPEEIDRLRALIETSGGLAATHELLNALVEEAMAALDGLDVDDVSRDALLELAAVAAGTR